jgi:hypothetical protein
MIRWAHTINSMSSIPRIARVPLTAKQPDACPHCGSHALTRRGTRRKKLEIITLVVPFAAGGPDRHGCAHRRGAHGKDDRSGDNH